MKERNAFKAIRAIMAGAAILWLGGCATKDDTAAPAPAPNPEKEVVRVVSSTSRLYTTEYVVKKIVMYDDVVSLKGSFLSHSFDIPLPQNARKILIPVTAHIKGYIDFSGFSESNVVYSPDSSKIKILLPDPQIELSATKVDNMGIKSIVGFGRSEFTQHDMEKFLKQGRDSIIKAIPSMGIAREARLQAYNVLSPMIQAMGYAPEDITVEFSSDVSNANYLKHLIKITNE